MTREHGFEGLIFVALMFIGAGIGLLFGRPDVGGAIGMGLGFLAMAIIRYYGIRVHSERHITLKSTIGVTLLMIIGLMFIAIGLSMLLNLEYLLKYITGLASIAVGLIFIVAALNIITAS